MRRKDAHDRAAIMESLREQLKHSDKALVGNKGYRRFVKLDPAHHFSIDEEQINQDARYDGLFVLRHDTGLDEITVAHAYKMLWMVKDTFRTAKTTTFLLRSALCGHAALAIRAAGSGLPPTIRQVA